MNSPTKKESGALVATLLARAWRPEPPPLDFSLADFERVAPLLLATGAGALAWRRVRNGPLEVAIGADDLHQVCRLNILTARVNQSRIEKVFAVLRSVAIEPILIKGWTAARYYPEPGLRPYGDIDICVRRQQFQDAQRALADLDLLRFKVDLHSGFAKFGSSEEEEFFTHSQLVTIGHTDIRILGAEDHLGTICFHLMREGAWRPLWLTDVAAALESRPEDFDWNYCLREKQQAVTVLGAITLAHQLLGAETGDLSRVQTSWKEPRWLVPTVLNEWGSTSPAMTRRHEVPMLGHLRTGKNLIAGLGHRWPNAIEATVSMNGPFNDLPRLPFQIGNALLRIGVFLSHLPKTWNK